MFYFEKCLDVCAVLVPDFQTHQFESFVYHVRRKSNQKLKAQHQLIFYCLLFCLHFLTEKGSVSLFVSVVTTLSLPLLLRLFMTAVFSLSTGGDPPPRTSLGSISVSVPAEQRVSAVSVTSRTSGELTENWASVEIVTSTVRELLKHTFTSAHELWHLQNWKKRYFYLKTVEVSVGCSFSFVNYTSNTDSWTTALLVPDAPGSNVCAITI